MNSREKVVGFLGGKPLSQDESDAIAEHAQGCMPPKAWGC